MRAMVEAKKQEMDREQNLDDKLEPDETLSFGSFEAAATSDMGGKGGTGTGLAPDLKTAM